MSTNNRREEDVAEQSEILFDLLEEYDEALNEAVGKLVTGDRKILSSIKKQTQLQSKLATLEQRRAHEQSECNS